MTYSNFVDELAESIDSLSLRSRAAIFWLFGSGLLTGLVLPDEWTAWFAAARRIGYEFITTGHTDADSGAFWDQARMSTGAEPSQLLHSAIICMSTPLGIAGDPTLAVGSWGEHALFPIMQSVSLEMFDDVALPDDDEELDKVFAQPQVQQAVGYCRNAVSRLATLPSPDGSALADLLDGARLLAPPLSPGAQK